VTKFITLIVIELVTLKATIKLDILFNKPASDPGFIARPLTLTDKNFLSVDGCPVPE
jgi:hypothetical protein